MQTTLRRKAHLKGIGLHSGRPARLTISPASAHHGIWFRRVDMRDRDNLIQAVYDQVSDTRLNTRIQNADGASVSTVEHLMAALAGCGVHNALVEVDGPEVPILDGSAIRFVEAILAAGLREQDAPLRVLRILKPVAVEEGDVSAALLPHEGLEIDYEIDFDEAAIGRQALRLDLANGAFVRELSDCRTFVRHWEVDALQAAGLARGGSLQNAVVVDGARVMNPEGFRRRLECVRHKMLDALGDLALAGTPIIGRYVGRRAGHGPTNRLLRQLFATPGAVRLEVCPDALRPRLPGMGVVAADLAAVS